ncbi:hypothetical protein BX600DRAFT_386030 [Xylariales sp. PMI_506]|nr:hypothetical protein BX600DRAFT_386030 [Xylariales sp. PMI_506]
MLAADVWDYIIVGGGIAGSVLSNRLLAIKPSAKILVIEAGPNVNNRSDILYVNSTNLIGGDFDWNYYSAPQTNLNNRTIQSAAGKALGGGSVINSCGWTRGNKVDFDEWAQIVGDTSWDYEAWLPYFKAAETFWSDKNNADDHGHSGPLALEVPSTTGREYPLRDTVYASYESIGIEALPGLDGNAGNNLGFGENVEDRRDGQRQVAAKYFPLDDITVLTETLVEKILIETTGEGGTLRATGVQLVNGTQIFGHEIIASAGSYRTPQLLMLSGVGPAETLAEFGIEQKLNVPDVGQNFLDHIFYLTQWQLDSNYSNVTVDSGNPLFAEPQYGLGQPNDFIAAFTVNDTAGLIDAITKDEGQAPDPATHPLLKSPRTFMEAFVLYVNTGVGLPTNFTYLTVGNVGLHPSARGSVTISSSDPTVPPVIDPNFFGSEVDRFVWRYGIRKMIEMMVGGESALSQGVVVGEAPPTGLEQLTLNSSDEEIDTRIQATAVGTYHPMGTCAMGKVIDTSLRVKGIDNLRVVDASIFPTPITAHIQQAVYALGIKAADIIASS